MHVHSEYDASETVNTMIHELLHAIFHLYSIREWSEIDYDLEEKLCSVLGNGLTELVVRNPKLILFLWESLHGGESESTEQPNNS